MYSQFQSSSFYFQTTEIDFVQQACFDNNINKGMSKQYHWDGISLQPHVSYNSPQPQSAYAIVLDHPSERISNVHISNHLQSGPAVSYSPWSPSHISDESW